MSEEYTEEPTPEQEGAGLPPMADGGVWMQHGGLPPVYVVGQTHIDRLFAEGAYIIDDPRTVESESASEDEQSGSDDTPTDGADAPPTVENRPARSTSRRRLAPVRQSSDDIPALRGVPDVTVRQTGKHDEEDA
jgi:hypothetical protein